MALVVTRKVGESVQIGQDIFVTFLEKTKAGGRTQVRLMIQAPESVRIERVDMRKVKREEPRPLDPPKK